MRTTISLDDEVAAAVRRLRKERGTGVSAAVNDLARRGLAAEAHAAPHFEQETSAIGLKIGVDNVAEALEQLDD
ncbi:MAG: ribbon-helix-helix protein, CopG family [Solirubrobacterales bacterium]